MITLKCAYFENKRRKYIFVFVFFISICFFIIIAQITIITVSSIFIINDDVVVVIVIVFTISGVPRFCKDLEVMLGIPVNIYFKVCWYGVSPIAVFVSILLKHRKTQDDRFNKYVTVTIEKLWLDRDASPWSSGYRADILSSHSVVS